MNGCSVQGCDRPHRKGGFCNIHYMRFCRDGHPGPLIGEPKRWLLEVALQYKGSECLIWPFGQSSSGYGSTGAGTPHRAVCMLANGQPPSSAHQAAHSCGTKLCVNPAHLRWATRAENEADKISHGTANRGERNGHRKLSVPDVWQIRRLAGRLLQREIGDLFGINRSAVSSIISRKAWSWLPDEPDEWANTSYDRAASAADRFNDMRREAR